MASSNQFTQISGKALWTGRVLTGLALLFLLFDSIVKILKLSVAVQATTQLGYPAGVILPLGIVLLVCVVLYGLPRTSALGAILLTGYLGGAVATHVRVGNPLFSHVLFPVYIALLIWGGLYLRDPRLRALLPVSQSAASKATGQAAGSSR
ncbi:MAG TPA: DoxX family protein [Candidatus Sulfotelmatobacter sp.]|nr:DoxX family protein [Candidatus Sulfotelmatobacter sp.]